MPVCASIHRLPTCPLFDHSWLSLSLLLMSVLMVPPTRSSFQCVIEKLNTVLVVGGGGSGGLTDSDCPQIIITIIYELLLVKGRLCQFLSFSLLRQCLIEGVVVRQSRIYRELIAAASAANDVLMTSVAVAAVRLTSLAIPPCLCLSSK